MACGVAEHPEPVPAMGVGHAGGAQRQDVALGGVDVVDLDVEVKLLRAPRVGKSRRLMLRRQLKREPPARRIGQNRPRLVFLRDSAAE